MAVGYWSTSLGAYRKLPTKQMPKPESCFQEEPMALFQQPKSARLSPHAVATGLLFCISVQHSGRTLCCWLLRYSPVEALNTPRPLQTLPVPRSRVVRKYAATPSFRTYPNQALLFTATSTHTSAFPSTLKLRATSASAHDGLACCR